MLGLTHMTPGVRSLLIAVLVATVGCWIVDAAAHFPAVQLLSFDGGLFTHGWLWQAVTYPFVYPFGALIPLIFNGLMLWVFGNWMEEEVGTRRFYRVFATATVLGALAAALTTLAGFAIPLFGLEVPVYAISMMFCLLNREATINFALFIMFIPVKGKYMGVILTLLAFVTKPVWIPSFLAALAGAYLIVIKRWWPAVPATKKKKKSRSNHLKSVPAAPIDKVSPMRSPTFQRNEGPSTTEIEVDRILDKLSKQGMSSLTPQEKETLELHSRSLQLRDKGL